MQIKNKHLSFGPLSTLMCQTKAEWEREQKQSYETLCKNTVGYTGVATRHSK